MTEESLHLERVPVPGLNLNALKDPMGRIVGYRHTIHLLAHTSYQKFIKKVNATEVSGLATVRLRNTGELLYFRSLIKTIVFLS